MNRSILENKILDEAEWLVEQLKEKNAEGSQEGIDPKKVIVKTVNNVISCLVFGSKCSLDEDFENKMETIDMLLQNIPRATNIIVQIFYRYEFFHFLLLCFDKISLITI